MGKQNSINPMAPFDAVLEDRHGWIKRYKSESGRKIAGYFCDYMPEEIMWAAGYATIRVTGEHGNVGPVEKHMQSMVCSFARRCLDQLLDGTFDYLDALVVPHTCDAMTKLYDLVAYRMKTPEFIHYLYVPHKVFDEQAYMVMKGEVDRLKKCVEEYAGASISDDDLADAIALYDKSRALLKEIYELRRSSPPKITGVEAFTIALTSLLTPKDIHVEWMEAFLEDMGDGRERLLREKPRVMISASVMDEIDIVKAVENAGAWVVADDVCSGSRYFWDTVGSPDGKPLKALTNRYLNKLPCPRSVGSMGPRREHILRLAADYKVDGVIFHILRCCDAHLYQYSILNDRLKKEGYRAIYLQGDQTIGMNEALVNRIAAFAEMLQM